MSLKTFRTRIRQSLADGNLQIALDNNAKRRTDGRVAAFASLPDFQERRQRAHGIKAEVVAHLDEYLAQFIANVEKNGIQVHRAADASEAIRIFLEIARPIAAKHASPLLVAKSKSMISEEVNFNYALAEAGLRVDSSKEGCDALD